MTRQHNVNISGNRVGLGKTIHGTGWDWGQKTWGWDTSVKCAGNGDSCQLNSINDIRRMAGSVNNLRL